MRTLILCLVLVGVSRFSSAQAPPDACAQDGSRTTYMCRYTAKVTVKPRQSSCELSDVQDLHFGTLEVPSSGTLGVEYAPNWSPNGRLSEVNAFNPQFPFVGNPTIGKMKVTMSGWSQFTLSPFTFSLTLQRSGCSGPSDDDGSCRIFFSDPTWAYSPNGRDPWSSGLSGQRYREPGTDTMISYYQIGGTVTIPAGTPPGTYEGRLNIMISCS